MVFHAVFGMDTHRKIFFHDLFQNLHGKEKMLSNMRTTYHYISEAFRCTVFRDTHTGKKNCQVKLQRL